MCGLIYVRRHDNRPAAKSVRKRYEKQKGRGQEGFGYVAIKDSQVVAYERATTEAEIMHKMLKETAPEILFHHRFPTSIPNIEEAAHPIKVEHSSFENQYYVAHNGIISNAYARKTEHEKLGHIYSTELKETFRSIATGKLYNGTFSRFNDSEALAIDTACAFETQTPIGCIGPTAVIGFIVNNGRVADRFFYRNNSNPLHLTINGNMTTLTSAFSKAGKEVPSLRIMHFGAKGEMKEYPHPLYVPLSYDYSGYNTPRALPSRREEPALDFEDYHFERYAPLEEGISTIVENLFSGVTTPLIATEKNDLFVLVESFDDEQLWSEYNRCIDGLLSLHSTVEQLDEAMEKAKDTMDGHSVLESRRKVQLRIDRCNEYQKLIEDEIEIRVPARLQ